MNDLSEDTLYLAINHLVDALINAKTSINYVKQDNNDGYYNDLKLKILQLTKAIKELTKYGNKRFKGFKENVNNIFENKGFNNY